MSVSVVLGNAPAYAGGASFALFLVLLAWASAIDLRERRIPNKPSGSDGGALLAVRVLLAAMAAACCAAGFGSGAQIGDAALVASATMMKMIPSADAWRRACGGACARGWLACGLDRVRASCPSPLHGRRGHQVACGGRTVPGLGAGAVVPVRGMPRRPCDADASRSRGGKGIASQTFPFAPAILVGVIIASIL